MQFQSRRPTQHLNLTRSEMDDRNYRDGESDGRPGACNFVDEYIALGHRFLRPETAHLASPSQKYSYLAQKWICFFPACRTVVQPVYVVACNRPLHSVEKFVAQVGTSMPLAGLARHGHRGHLDQYTRVDMYLPRDGDAPDSNSMNYVD